MNKITIYLRLLGVFLIAFANFPVSAIGADAVILSEIRVSGNSIIMDVSGQTKYTSFKTDTPARIIVDLANTEHKIEKKQLEVYEGLIKIIRSGQFKNEPEKIVRIVIDLTEIVEYEIKGSENQVAVVLKTGDAQQEAKEEVPEPEPETQDPGLRTLDDVRVEENKVIMTTSKETKFNAFKISNPDRLVVEFTNTEHDWKQKSLDVNKGYIKRIRSGQFQNEPVKIARVVVDLTKAVEYELTGQGTEVTLELNPGQAKKPPSTVKSATKVVTKTVKPAVVAAAPKVIPKKIRVPIKKSKSKKKKKVLRKKKKAKAEKAVPKSLSLPKTPINLDCEEADIRDILRTLSMKSGINIIYGNDVTGKVTIHLKDVPFDSALETVLSLNGYVSQEQGPNILRVTTPKAISEERAQAITFTKIVPLNYANAKDVKDNLDAVRTAEGRKGNISVDARTNSLIITDTPSGFISIEKLINELDKKPQQVLIEAKIVEMVLTDSFDVGIQWQYAGAPVNSANSKVNLGASEVITGNEARGVATTGNSTLEVKGIADGGTGVAFPAAPAGGQAGAISFGIIANNNYLNGVLTSLAQKGLSKILSTPRVTTINNEEAKILVGQKIPYTTATTVSGGGATTQNTEFLDVGIKLTVIPTINVDERITLYVHPEVSLYVRADPAGPVLGNREAETTVLVENGETVVIAGLITEEDRKLGTQVPLLGDLPVIGHLFRRDFKTKERNELLIFITPRVLDN